MRHEPTRAVALATALMVAAVVGLVLYGRIPQDPAYHGLADRRTLLGVPNALDVLSNLPFLVIGWLGLRVALRGAGRGSRASDAEAAPSVIAASSPFADPWERWPSVALFGGTLLTAFGSAWYHLAPGNARLVWDRLPMTVAFIGLLVALLAERLSVPAARRVFAPLLLFGIASVVYWRISELRGDGDLRPYALVQFGSLLGVVLLVALLPPGRAAGARRADSGWLLGALAGYAAAKGLEAADHQIYSLGGVVSGHTLKHLAAAAGVWCLVARLEARLPPRG